MRVQKEDTMCHAQLHFSHPSGIKRREVAKTVTDNLQRFVRVNQLYTEQAAFKASTYYFQCLRNPCSGQHSQRLAEPILCVHHRRFLTGEGLTEAARLA